MHWLIDCCLIYWLLRLRGVRATSPSRRRTGSSTRRPSSCRPPPRRPGMRPSRGSGAATSPPYPPYRGPQICPDSVASCDLATYLSGLCSIMCFSQSCDTLASEYFSSHPGSVIDWPANNSSCRIFCNCNYLCLSPPSQIHSENNKWNTIMRPCYLGREGCVLTTGGSEL